MLPTEKRGPKIGDAASLWNFTPSPGWSKDEVLILRLSLMKFGIGKWVQILDTGLLPGKLIQQLNGQTQRLLGQQSLAAYTGLQVDLDRIRADNEARTDVQRKQGLIINTGPNLTKEMKEKLRQEAKIEYGLTPEQIREAEEQLQIIETKMKGTAAAAKYKLDQSLMTGDASKLSKDEKIELLNKLHTTLVEMKALAEAKEDGKAPENPAILQNIRPAKNQQKQQKQQQADGPSSSGEQENKAAAANPAAMDIDNPKPAARKSNKPASGAAKGGKRKSRAKAAYNSDSDDDDEANLDDDAWGSDEDMGDAAARAAAKAADVKELMAMGFSAQQARDALEDAGGNIDVAANWLVANCV